MTAHLRTLALAALLIACCDCIATAPSSMAECRATAAQQARTETGARAMLSECAKKFSPAPPPAAADVDEQECLAQGRVFEPSRLTGPKCDYELPERPCTAGDIAINSDARVSKAVCEARGNQWSNTRKLCSKPGRSTLVIVCKMPPEVPTAYR